MGRNITPREWRAKLRRITGPTGRANLEKALFTAAQIVAVDAAISVTTGAVSGKNHVPSSPGQPPNADSHVLDKSIQPELAKSEKPKEIRARVIADAPYAKALEKGSSTTEARPFLGPSLSRNRRQVRKMLVDAVNHILRNNR